MFLFQANNLTLRSGHITHPPMRNQDPNSGSLRTLFRIASKRYRPQRDRYYDFMLCIAYDSQAEKAAKLLSKGTVITVAGPLQSYFTEIKGATTNTGKPVEVERFYIHVSDFQVLGHYVSNEESGLHGGEMRPGGSAKVPYEEPHDHA